MHLNEITVVVLLVVVVVAALGLKRYIKKQILKGGYNVKKQNKESDN